MPASIGPTAIAVGEPVKDRRGEPGKSLRRTGERILLFAAENR
jgi:hypothetical protein